MFTLHEATRRLICRTAFIALGVVPTLCVVVWTAWRLSPSVARAEAQSLSQELGLTVTIGRVSFPRPHVRLYENLRCIDSETRQSVAEARVVEMDASSDVTVVTVSQLDVNADRLASVVEVISRKLRDTTVCRAKLAPCDITLRSVDRANTLTGVRGEWTAEPKSAVCSMRFRVAGVEATNDATLRAERARDGKKATTQIALDTGGAALPTGLITPLWGGGAKLGADSRWRGSIWTRETPEGWQGGARGQATGVNLDTLISDTFPHRLTGVAEITIDDAVVRAGRLERANGYLTAGPGSVGVSLLAAAQSELGCERPEPAVKSLSRIRGYKELAFSFALDAKLGLVLEGRCQDSPGAILLDDHRQALLTEPDSAQSVVSLVRMLVPENSIQAPQTQQTDDLNRWLPLPSLVPAGAERPPRATRLRTKPAR